ncbi:hypothetical protein COU59_00855 [Candidatus Pacearchaeota archaeon CG10_big_fil_rev_8_21_14_0_10_34_12]|nr:MAG: hypothetical protein COU59_00855 [Candidatus Pacearchaeota archaeon CG10_big_fil_rev_8_21_14_0_10_34_12]
MKKWEILSSDKIINNKWLTVEKQSCRTGNGKTINDYYIVGKKNYVVLVIEDGGGIFFAEQYRHGAGEIMLNLPMGVVDDGETKEESARREMLEETGYEPQSLDFLGNFFPAPAFMPAKAHVFYTNKIIKKSKAKSDDEEEIRLVKIPKSMIKTMIEKNEIKDISSVAAIYLAKSKGVL